MVAERFMKKLKGGRGSLPAPLCHQPCSDNQSGYFGQTTSPSAFTATFLPLRWVTVRTTF